MPLGVKTCKRNDMKKTVAILAVVIMSASVAFASQVGEKVDPKHQQRVNDMNMMAQGFNMVLNGFLYNSERNVVNGVKLIQGGVTNIKEQGDLKKYLPEDTAYAYKFGEKTLRRIMEYSTEVVENFQAKDADAAMESGMLLLRQCNSCHSRVRGW